MRTIRFATALTAVACIVTSAVLTVVATASPAGKNRTHFAGLPPVGVRASTPTTGRLLLGVRQAETEWNVYADGRIIWQKWTRSGRVVPKGARRLDTGYVQQRLMFSGVQLLLSKVIATGLFEHNVRLDVGKGNPWVFHRVRRGDRTVTLSGVPSPDRSWPEHFTKATPAQTHALAWIEKLVADPARSLPTEAWADRRIRAFVPARYMIAVDRSYPALSKLPAPARKQLVQYKRLRRHACQIVTTDQARALLQTFAEAGISPSDNHASNIAFDFATLQLPHPSYLHLHPARPGDRC